MGRTGETGHRRTGTDRRRERGITVARIPRRHVEQSSPCTGLLSHPVVRTTGRPVAAPPQDRATEANRLAGNVWPAHARCAGTVAGPVRVVTQRVGGAGGRDQSCASDWPMFAAPADGTLDSRWGCPARIQPEPGRMAAGWGAGACRSWSARSRLRRLLALRPLPSAVRAAG
ncbi:hypothetical protein ATKI12_0175 [Kitasatospora sp. Ki12]